MTIGAIGSCSDSSTNPLRQAAVERPGEEKLNPVEEANRLAEKENGLDATGIRDQRVNPTEDAARSGSTHNLAQAAQVNELRNGESEATEGPGGADESAERDQPPASQPYQAAEAGDERFPNRGGVLDFQI